MKQRSFNTLAILLLFTINSCYSPVNQDYHRAIDRLKINNFLIDHFPENLKRVSGKFTLADKAAPEIHDDFARIGYCFLQISPNNEELTILIDSLNKSRYPKYLPDQEPVFIPLRFSEKHKYDKNFVSKYIDHYVSNDSIENKLLPIPKFKDQLDFAKKHMTITGLPNSFQIFVVESKKIDKDEMANIKFPLINDISKPLFPSEWRHGYSKGVSIDSSNVEIIYWTIFW